MMINALNSGAQVFMADLEDALCPTWANVIGGQVALARRACAATLAFDDARGQAYRSNDADGDARRPAARLAPRRAPRARRRRADVGAACSTSGCTCSTTPRRRSRARAAGPYFYLPKLESHLEARLWNDVFVHGAGRRSASRAARSARRC